LISPNLPRSDTLQIQPATLSLMGAQVARAPTSPCEFPRSQDSVAATLTQPIGQLLQGSPD